MSRAYLMSFIPALSIHDLYQLFLMGAICMNVSLPTHAQNVITVKNMVEWLHHRVEVRCRVKCKYTPGCKAAHIIGVT